MVCTRHWKINFNLFTWNKLYKFISNSMKTSLYLKSHAENNMLKNKHRKGEKQPNVSPEKFLVTFSVSYYITNHKSLTIYIQNTQLCAGWHVPYPQKFHNFNVKIKKILLAKQFKEDQAKCQMVWTSYFTTAWKKWMITTTQINEGFKMAREIR